MIRRWKSTYVPGAWAEIDVSVKPPIYRTSSYSAWAPAKNLSLEELIGHFEDQMHYKEVTNKTNTPVCEHAVGYMYDYPQAAWVCRNCKKKTDDIVDDRLGNSKSASTVQSSDKHKCRCDMTTLMRTGCQCNGA